MPHPAVMTDDLTLPPRPLDGGIAARLGSVARRTLRRSPEDAHLLSELLDFAAAAEQRIAEQRARIAYLESLAQSDELTGIANRRGFEQFLKTALAAAQRHEEQGLVGFFDLDHFKEINDRYGHAAGDAVLRHVADLLKKAVRAFDCAARLGGDEFAVVLTRSRPLGGTQRLKTLQDEINASVVLFEGVRIPISISLGIDAFGGDDDLRTLLFRADRAMYRDKRSRGSA